MMVFRNESYEKSSFNDCKLPASVFVIGGFFYIF